MRNNESIIIIIPGLTLGSCFTIHAFLTIIMAKVLLITQSFTALYCKV